MDGMHASVSQFVASIGHVQRSCAEVSHRADGVHASSVSRGLVTGEHLHDLAHAAHAGDHLVLLQEIVEVETGAQHAASHLLHIPG